MQGPEYHYQYHYHIENSTVLSSLMQTPSDVVQSLVLISGVDRCRENADVA